MARYYGGSTERGYGNEHQKLRRALLAKWRPGDPCARCGRPMWDKKRIDLGHTDDRAGYRGLEHSFCNRKAGAGKGNRGRQVSLVKYDARQGAPCATCGQLYRHPAQNCAICGSHFHRNNGRVQYTCSRPCGVEFRRRNMVRNGWQPRTMCACGNVKGKTATRCAACREAAALQRIAARPGPATKISYYTCRYCGQLKVTSNNSGRQVCPDPACQLDRVRENKGRLPRMQLPPLPPPARPVLPRSATHRCPACGELTGRFSWCDACMCTGTNAKGRRCGNLAAKCEQHPAAA